MVKTSNWVNSLSRAINWAHASWLKCMLSWPRHIWQQVKTSYEEKKKAGKWQVVKLPDGPPAAPQALRRPSDSNPSAIHRLSDGSLCHFTILNKGFFSLPSQESACDFIVLLLLSRHKSFWLTATNRLCWEQQIVLLWNDESSLFCTRNFTFF